MSIREKTLIEKLDYNNLGGADLLRTYREYDISTYHLEHKLTDEIEKLVSNHTDQLIGYDVFINDSGKYIIITTYNGYELPERFIESFTIMFNVTYEGVTRELHEDYEGNISTGNLTYLFEIIK